MLFMGKFTISMVIFHSYVSHYQRLNPVKSPHNNPQQNLERWDGFSRFKAGAQFGPRGLQDHHQGQRNAKSFAP